MRLLKVFSCGLIVALSIASGLVAAQENPAVNAGSVKRDLADLMLVTQLRHAKLFYAGRGGNWSLADYQLRQLDLSLKEAQRLYASVSAPDLSAVDLAVTAASEAIKKKDDAGFKKSFGQLTAACNGCHATADRAFIAIRLPTLPSPYSNQLFRPFER